MIVCVCLNPALDVTYQVPLLMPGATHQVRLVGRRGGGKGINVARVLGQLGEAVVVAGLLGGATGEAIETDLADSGIPRAFLRIAGDSRRSVCVVDGKDATVFNEAGPVIDGSEWDAFLEAFDGLVREARVVVMSGSLPPGVPTHAYRELTMRAKSQGALTVVDAAGRVLLSALEAHPDIVKPNAVELGELGGESLTRRDDVVRAARTLLRSGAGGAVVSRGAEGLVALTPAGLFASRAPARIEGNPTGAGDALTAALAAGLARGEDWPTTLARGVAISAAAVTVPLAGETDLAYAQGLIAEIEVEELTWP